MERLFKLVKTIKIEPFILLYIFGYSVSDLTTKLLIQDKICRNVYQESVEFCLSLNDINSQNVTMKNKILADSAKFSVYQTVLSTAPMILGAFMMGPWMDKYIHARKYLMCAASASAIIEFSWLMINSIYFNNSKQT
jgi:hypothetical protein